MTGKKKSDINDGEGVPKNPFLHVDLFPGFVPSQETIDYVNARFGGIRQKPHHRMGANGKVSQDTLEDAKKLAAELIKNGFERGEIEFTKGHPLVVTTDRSKVGDMGSFELAGKIFYIGFE